MKRIFILVVALLCVGPSSVSAQDISLGTTSPSAWMPFNGNPYDAVTGSELVERGGVSYHQGIKGDAVALNGTSGVVFGNLPGSQFEKNAFTLSLWVKRDSTRRADLSYLAGVWGVGSSVPAYALSLRDGRPAFSVGNLEWLSGPALLPNIWHHLLVTVAEGSSGDLEVLAFVNGVPEPLVVSGAWDGDPLWRAPYAGAFVVGGNPDHDKGTFGGALDEVRLYDRTLSPEDALNLYDFERPNRRIERFSVAFFADTFFETLLDLFSW